MLTEKALTHVEEKAQSLDHKPFPDNLVELGSDVVMMMLEEIREYRAYQADVMAITERQREYTQKHGLLGFAFVADAVLADAERLRAENAALRAALESIRSEARSIRRADHSTDEKNLIAQGIAVMADAALNPDATANTVAPKAAAGDDGVIKVGDKVRITAGTYEGLECRVTVVGLLTATLITPDGKYMPIHVSRLEVIEG